jgi:hypothetical protein
MITLDEAVARYGKIGDDGKWKREQEFCLSYKVPEKLNIQNSLTGKALTRIYCNSDMIDALGAAFGNAIIRGVAGQIKTFDGCYNIRPIRGDYARLSCHSYALAIDINAYYNRLGTDGNMSKELVQCFKDAGFGWGGDFSRHDPMHYTMGW